MDYIINLLHKLSKHGAIARSSVKTILRIITSKHELERLCMSGKHGYRQCREVEYSLYHSKDEEMRNILIADNVEAIEAMQTILRSKEMIPEEEIHFLSNMSKFLRKLITYNIVLNSADSLRACAYDEKNTEHEQLLIRLWSLMKGPNDKLAERHSTRWTEIGFLGKNPATEFRGMGLLALVNLIYLFEKDDHIGRKIWKQSQHPEYGFSFAVMSIHFTFATFKLLRSGKLKGYMYNLPDKDEYSLCDYQNFFVELFSEFSDYWMLRKPRDIMAFTEVYDFFMLDVTRRLVKGNW